MKREPYPLKGGARGVNSDKKRDIIDKIGPVMKQSCLRFWNDLPECDSSRDLTLNYDKVNDNVSQKSKRSKRRK